MARRAGQGDEGYGGHWIYQLLHQVLGVKEIELGVVTAFPGLCETHFREGSVEYFTISQPDRFPAFDLRSSDLKKCAAIIEEFKPDVIHVHGSERFYGLVKVMGLTSAPVLVSIQGLLGPYSISRNFFGALSPIEILKSIRFVELPLKLGLLWQYISLRKGAKREKRILAAVEGVLGRTEWDYAHTRLTNPEANYYHVGEIMRPVFYESQWQLDDCDRHTLIYTNAGNPRRGTENLFSAVSHLRKEFPDIRLRLAGSISTKSGYGRFIRGMINKLGINDRIDFLGYLDEKAMARELLRSHVFAITSYIENSPNSLAEAMLAGMPCVASFVGGIPDMVSDHDTGLLYPVEDVPLLVNKIRSVFNNDRMAIRLGESARRAANDRHDPKIVVKQLMAAYHKAMAASKR